MIGNAAFANDQDSTWFWSSIENFGHILTSKSYVGYALVQSILIGASLYALYCGTFHAAQDNNCDFLEITENALRHFYKSGDDI